MPENENGRPGKGGPESSTATKNTTIVPPLDPWCCGSYSVAELRLGFGCPAHTRGPL